MDDKYIQIYDMFTARRSESTLSAVQCVEWIPHLRSSGLIVCQSLSFLPVPSIIVVKMHPLGFLQEAASKKLEIQQPPIQSISARQINQRCVLGSEVIQRSLTFLLPPLLYLLTGYCDIYIYDILFMIYIYIFKYPYMYKYIFYAALCNLVSLKPSSYW
jgi:hypothetical protein